jgi:hypothetical protein
MRLGRDSLRSSPITTPVADATALDGGRGGRSGAYRRLALRLRARSCVPSRELDLRRARDVVVVPASRATREEGRHARTSAVAVAMDCGLRGARRCGARRPHPARCATMALMNSVSAPMPATQRAMSRRAAFRSAGSVVQPGARRPGSDGIGGNVGTLESVSCRF